MYEILIADDEMLERNVIRYLLEKNRFPFAVTEASNGREALRLLESKRFHVLFTDIKMPFMDGLALASRAREMDEKLHIVFFSGYSDFSFAKEAISLRAVNYVLKPVDPEEFRETFVGIVSALDKEEGGKVTEQDRPSEMDGSHAVQLIGQYVRDHYMESLSLESLAEEVYLSPRYLSALFAKETGMGLSRYIKMIRMEKAKELLIGSNMRVSDVASLVGYPNVSYFCKTFQNVYGVTPERYRELPRSRKGLPE